MRVEIIRKRSAAQLFFGVDELPAAGANSIAMGRPAWYKVSVNRHQALNRSVANKDKDVH
jgi:hypothetical protein